MSTRGEAKRLEARLATGITGSELGTDALRRRVTDAWRLRQRSRYVEHGRLLPGLLTDAHASRELAGDDQVQALGVAAYADNTATSVLLKLGDNVLALIAADRAVQAARTVGDPLLLGACAYRLANVFLPTGRLVEAKEVALSAAAWTVVQMHRARTWPGGAACC